MNCPICGSKCRTCRKRVRRRGALPFLLELLAVGFIVAGFTVLPVVGIGVGLALALIAHMVTYQSLVLAKCPACRKEFPCGA